MNVKLLRKVKQHILAVPKRFYMPSVIRHKFGDERLEIHEDLHVTKKTRPFPKCGMAGCIAGWTCLLSGSENASGFEAARLLELDGQEANRLFFGYGPKKFVDIWTGDGTSKTALLVAARIEHFIKTKGKE